jgi:cytidyltransferase-like protein
VIGVQDGVARVEGSWAVRYRNSIEALPRHGKSNYGAPAYSRFINRPVGRRLAAAANATGLTPNIVTGISAAFSLIGIVLLVAFPPTIGLGIAVSALLAIGYALDSADGQLARLQGGGRPVGEWLDHTVDMAKTVLLHAAVLIGWLRYDGIGWVQAMLPMGFVTVTVVAFFAWLLVDLLRRSTPGTPAGDKPQGAPLARSLLRLPSDYGLLLWTFVLWGTGAFLPVYGLLFLANAAILALALPVWYRQAAALPRPKAEVTTTRGRVGYIPGVYDLFHIGHLNILRAARANCDYLVAGVVSDERAEAGKGRRPVIPLDERLAIVNSVGLVDEVVVDDSTDKAQMLDKVRFDVIFKGDDWRNTPKGDQLEASMAAEGVEVHYFPYTETTSSTLLRQRITE